jgi:zinc protease
MSLSVPSIARADDQLPTDPALVTGELPNGLKYVVRKHANPPARASVWMHVSSGSLNETDKQRGIAHYLEHMAFNGSENFPPGTVINFFQDLGLSFGRHQNAFTSFDQTTYQLAMPDNSPENLTKALTFMSDVSGKLLLLPKEIDEERQVIMEEKRSRLSPQQRVQEYMLERLAPGATFGQRLPIGIESTIMGVQKQDFVDYYTKWYTKSNTTVIVVADVEPKVVVDQITKLFSGGEKLPKPVDMPVGVKPYTEDRAIVATDPELTSAEVGFVKLALPNPPTTTYTQARRELVELIGSWAFNRRIARNVEQGNAPYLSASAGASDLANAMRLIQATASGKKENWKSMLRELAAELQRARQFGFSEQEVADARSALISGAETSAQREATTDARALLNRYNRHIADGEPIMSAQQTLDMYRKLLPGITAQEVSASFTELTDPKNVTFTAQLPTSAPEIPSESDLIKLGREALGAKVEKASEVARVESLMKETPKAGKVADVSEHAASQVTSAWLDNGVRVHHRFMDIKKNEASISITLVGGEINETAANRGISQVAALAWNKPATKSMNSTQIREFMTAKKVGVGGGAGPDTMTLSVSGSPEALETGMQLAHLLLTQPVVEPAALAQWKDRQVQAIAARKTQPQGVFQEAVSESFYPQGEVRTRPLTEEQVTALQAAAAQSWLEGIIASAPIEVSVVGDISKDEAMKLVSTYLGSLPSRARITDKMLADKRSIKRNVGPIAVARTVETKTPVSVVMDGFFGADASNVIDGRLLQMASRTLSTRMIKVIREEKQLVYSIGAQSNPASVYPGFGMFMAVAPTGTEKVPALIETLEQMYEEFSKTGPTDAEMETARKQVANTLDEQYKEPSFWSARLGTLDYRGNKLDDTMNAPEAFKAITAAQVKDAFNRYYKPEARFRISVTPASSPAAEKPKDEPKKN